MSVSRPLHLSIKALLLFSTLIFSCIGSADNIKVAFLGDQGVKENARAVLSLVANEGTDLLLIQGDLGYGENTATRWEENLNTALGSDFPVLTVVGNHENFEWPLYQALIRQRVERVGKLSCSGEIGVKASCSFGNIEIVQGAPGVSEVPGVNPDDDYAQYIRNAFARTSNSWRICSWHKNQNRLQPGSKGDATGWDVYDACLDAGAMVAVAHEHAYARTHLLSNFETQTVAHTRNDMTLEPGRSFAFVSGLGGREVRSQKRGGEWWASIYTASQGATHGALFCDFGDATADCYFKAIDGAIPDRFTLRKSTNVLANLSSEPVQALEFIDSAQQGYVFSRTDKTEYRWVATDANGVAGNVWIDKTCADQLGGAVTFGDWKKLNQVSPGFDAIESPCFDGHAANVANENENNGGFVFSRSDKSEHRWIGKTDNGELGSIWIDGSCAERLGGTAVSGGWSELMAMAPKFDAIASPC